MTSHTEPDEAQSPVPVDRALPESNPWDRQSTETDRAHAAFLAYLRLPASRRSIARACEAEHGQSAGRKRVAQWERWSARHGWINRARAHDEHLARVEVQDRERHVREMNQRHRELVCLLVDVATLEARRVLDRLKCDTGPEIADKALIEIARHAVELDRLVHGVPNSVPPIRTPDPDENVVVKVTWGPDDEEAPERVE